MRRLLASYKLMLDFFGMRLENEATGLISRSENYASRYRNLCSMSFSSRFVLQSRPRSWRGRTPSSCIPRAPAISGLYLIRPTTSHVRSWTITDG